MDTVIQKISPNTWKIVAAVGTAGIIYKVVCISLKCKGKEKIPQKWANVAQVKQLIIYPVKSMKGVELEEAVLTPLGLGSKASKYLRDRAFLVVDGKGVFQTQRQHSTMTLISVNVNGDDLTFSAPGVEDFTLHMNTVEKEGVVKNCRIWLDKGKALDCGDAIGKWLDSFLNQNGLRLLYHVSTESFRKNTSSAGSDKFPHFTPTDLGTFQDDTAYMLMAEESIAVLNTKLQTPITYKWFRPVILVDGLREAFSEDSWTYIRFGDRANGPILKTCIPCSRCRITTIDPANGKFDINGQPLKTIFKDMNRKVGDDKTSDLVKKNAVLGSNFGLFQGNGSTIRVGDNIFVALL